jgi:hypothetical protein
MSKVLFVFGHIVLFGAFVALFVAGGMLGPFHMDPFGTPHWFLSHPSLTSTRYFVPTGLLLMTALWLLILAIEAAMNKLKTAALWTTLAYVAALAIGLALKFGWVETSLY